MSTALAVINAVPTVTAEQMDLVKRTVANGATADELKLYLFDCARQGVHPLDKLVHFTKRSGKYTPITSIDFMRIRAADTGEYAGSDDAVFLDGVGSPDFAATVTVWRLVQGQRCSFTATARWTEYKPDQDFMWKRMPTTMLAKCAEALALRKGFPRQLAGLYAKEELDQADRGAVSSNGRTPYFGSGNAGSTPAAAAIPVPADTDSITGEIIDPARTAPKGFHYITGYSFGNGWHEATLLNWDAQGGSLRVSTKRKFGELLQQAQIDGVPVNVKTSPKKNSVGEAYLEDVKVYKPEPVAVVAPVPMLGVEEIAF